MCLTLQKTLRHLKLQDCWSAVHTRKLMLTFYRIALCCLTGSVSEVIGTQLKLEHCFFIIISGIPHLQKSSSRADILSYLLDQGLCKLDDVCAPYCILFLKEKCVSS